MVSYAQILLENVTYACAAQVKRDAAVSYPFERAHYKREAETDAAVSIPYEKVRYKREAEADAAVSYPYLRKGQVRA